MSHQNYTIQITELEDKTLSIRVSENFYRNDTAAPITEHHRLSLAPGQSITPDQLADNVGAARKEWAINMRAGGDHVRMKNMITAAAGVVHTPQVIAAYEAKRAEQAVARP